MVYNDLIREALENMKHCVEIGNIILQFPQDERVIAAIMVALEKQIPMTAIAESNGSCENPEDWLECPECGESVPEYTAENEDMCYCVSCGQWLEWDSLTSQQHE